MTRLPLAEYLVEPGLWRFVTATLTSFKSNISLPGVFEANPFRFPMGTVWTLKYEVLCYAGVLLLGLSGAPAVPARRPDPHRWPRSCAGRDRLAAFRTRRRVSRRPCACPSFSPSGDLLCLAA